MSRASACSTNTSINMTSNKIVLKITAMVTLMVFQNWRRIVSTYCVMECARRPAGHEDELHTTHAYSKSRREPEQAANAN